MSGDKEGIDLVRHRHLNFGLDRFSGLYIGAAFIITFSIWAPNLFATTYTFDSIASAQTVTGILALAVLVPLVGGSYDLSVGSTANFAAIFVIELQTADHMNPVVAIIITLLAGLLIGFVNGFIVVRLRVNSFIATLGMGSVVLALLTMDTGNVQPGVPTSTAWSEMTQTSVGGIQVAFFYLVALALIVWWVLEHMPSGRYLFAIGSNAEAARLSGVPVGRYVWSSLTASGGLAAVAGIIFGSLLGPSLTFGQGLLLPAFAAVFLGSTQLYPGRFNVWGTMIAIYVLATGVQGFAYVTGVQWLSDMFNGVALIAAVAFAVWRQSVSSRGSDRTSAAVLAKGNNKNVIPPLGEVIPTDTGPTDKLGAESAPS